MFEFGTLNLYEMNYLQFSNFLIILQGQIKYLTFSYKN